MKQAVKTSLFSIICIFIIGLTSTQAQWLTDTEHNYKINVPSGWSQSQYLDGTDRISDLSSADGNIAIQIRSFEAGMDIDAQTMARLFDEGLKGEGANQLALSADELNGLPGIMGVYTNTMDGMEIAIVTFSAVKNQIGYLLFTVIPTAQFDQRVNEADAVLNSFAITQATAQNNNKPTGGLGGLGGLSGGGKKNSNTPTNNNTADNSNNYVTISSNDRNGTYHFSKSGSYPIKWNSVTCIRGLDENGRLMLEAYLRNHKGTGTFPLTENNELVSCQISTVNGLSVRGNENGPASGEMVITEYTMGGRIKGHFKVKQNGRDIEGKFDLALPTPKDFNGDDI